MVVAKPHLRPSGTSSYGSKNRSLTTATRPGGRSAPSQRWRGCGRYVRTAWCCDGLTSATPSVDFSTPRSLCCSGGGVCRPPGRTSESRCSSNTAQTPTMLWRGHMLMILARLVRSESFWAVVKVRSPHNGREPGYPRLDVHGKAWRREEVVVDAVASPEVGFAASRKVEVPTSGERPRAAPVSPRRGRLCSPAHVSCL